MLSTSICLRARALIASTNGPHRLPRIVTSLTTAGDRSIDQGLAQVLLSTIMPRGRTICSARASPDSLPEHSTIRSWSILGTALSTWKAWMPFFSQYSSGPRVAADHLQPAPRLGEHLGHQQPQPARADHRAAHVPLDGHLAKDLVGRGQRLDEDGLLVGDVVRQDVAVAFGHDDVVGEGPVAPGDAR